MSTPYYNDTPFADRALTAAAMPAQGGGALDEVVGDVIESHVRLIVSTLQTPGVGSQLAAPLAKAMIADPAAEQILLEHFMSKLPQRQQTVIHQHTHELDPTRVRYQRIYRDVVSYVTNKLAVVIGAVLGLLAGIVSMYFLQTGTFQLGGSGWQQTFSDAVDQPTYVVLMIGFATVFGAAIGALFRKKVVTRVADGREMYYLADEDHPVTPNLTTNPTTPSVSGA